jgi:hypothetical protein
MEIKKTALKKTVERLEKQATACFERADDQHGIANLQHANAEKLTILGQSLEVNALLLKGAIETGAGRTSPLVPTKDDKTSQRDWAVTTTKQK